jgi:hypothetical protein
MSRASAGPASCDTGGVESGMRLKPVFDDLPGTDITLPRYAPA